VAAREEERLRQRLLHNVLQIVWMSVVMVHGSYPRYIRLMLMELLNVTQLQKAAKLLIRARINLK
jgi:hypothetical protein